MIRYLSGIEPRRRECFDDAWEFALTGSLETPVPGTAWKSLRLPHDWSIETPIDRMSLSGGEGGYFAGGIGWYRKRFRLKATRGEQIRLLFDGVWKDCAIWLNGRLAGRHYNGYVSFSVDVTDLLTEGENECLVRVNNADQPNSRWYTGSGITRHTYIQATQREHMVDDGLRIIPTLLDHGDAEIQVTLETEGVDDHTNVELEAIDETGRAVARIGAKVIKNRAEAVLTLTQPRLWRLEDPCLYTLRADLKREERLLDRLEERFGVRSIHFDPMQGFYLNGTHVKLHGVCLHHDGGCVGAAVPIRVWERRFEKLREMGCNAVRIAHNPPDPEFLTLCDEMGLLVNAELFDEWHEVKKKTYHNEATDQSHGYGEVFDRYADEDTLTAVRRDRNHPSIILWSLGNEIPEQVRPEGMEILRRLRELVRSQDPSRPVTTANDAMHAEPQHTLDGFMAATDVIGANYIDRWGKFTELMFEPDKIAHPDRIYYGSEHSSIYGWRGDYLNAGQTTSWLLAPYASRMLKAERLMKFVETRDYVCGDFMWTGIDHLGENGWPMKSSICGVLDTAGFAKDGYYFYQSQWVHDRPVLHLFPWLNLAVPKDKIVPFVVYTNCASVELLVNGRSYGRKSYEFPAQGMKGGWDGFDYPIAEITTNDLHLTWDIPYQEGEIEAVGYDRYNAEIARARVQTAGVPARLTAVSDRQTLTGRDVAQIELTLTDSDGTTVPGDDREVTVVAEGPLRLLGMDNGGGDCHVPFAEPHRKTRCGRLYAIVESIGEAGDGKLSFSTPGVGKAVVSIYCENEEDPPESCRQK